MKKRIVVYLSQENIELMGECDKPSRRINEMLQRYGELCRRNLPSSLTTKEWLTAMAALRDYVANPGVDDPIRYLWAAVADYPDMAKCLEGDPDSLICKLRELPYSGQVAVYEAAMSFHEHEDLPDEEALRRLGLRRCCTCLSWHRCK